MYGLEGTAESAAAGSLLHETHTFTLPLCTDTIIALYPLQGNIAASDAKCGELRAKLEHEKSKHASYGEVRSASARYCRNFLAC